MKMFSWPKIACILTCALLMLCLMNVQAFAENDTAADIGAAVEDAINDAVNDAIHDATQGAVDNLKEKAENLSHSAVYRLLFQATSIEDINTMLSQYNPAILLLITALAVLFGLFGYRWFNLAIVVGGFASGILISIPIYNWVIGLSFTPDAESIPLIVPYIFYLIAGIVFAVLSKKIVRSGIFMVAAIGTYIFLNGFELFNNLIQLVWAGDGAWKYIVARIVVALIVGAVALKLTRPALVLATAAIGGTVAAISAMVALHITFNVHVEMVICLILFAFFAYFQFKHPGTRKQHSN